MITDNLRALILCGLMAIATAPSAVAQGDDPQLKGKVQKEETPVRIRRPGLPAPSVAEPLDLGTMQTPTAKKDVHLHGVAADDFMLNFKKQSPVFAGQAGKSAPADKALSADTEDEALIIAWEEWHHRVSEAIFERWRVLGMIPGVAHTTLSFTRAGRVYVTVHDIELPENVFSVMRPEYRQYSEEELKRRFTRAIQDSVMPLDGSSTVQFPEKSKRDIVTLTPNFSGDVDEGYNWKHGDYERVDGKQ